MRRSCSSRTTLALVSLAFALCAIARASGAGGGSSSAAGGSGAASGANRVAGASGTSGAAPRATARTLLDARTCEDAGAIGPDTARELRSLLAPLAASTYLSTFHVAIDSPCPFWSDDAQCVMRECSVSGCEPRDVPTALRNADKAAASAAAGSAAASAGGSAASSGPGADQGASAPSQPRSPAAPSLTVDYGTTPCDPPAPPELNDVDRSLVAPPVGSASLGWAARAEPDDWTVQDAPASQMIYVDLRKNPERFTGYVGSKSNRVWWAIYDENCFAVSGSCRTGVCSPDTCKEERVFYRAVSGLHTSITMHIAKEYLHGTKWGSNLDIFVKRVRAFPERQKNLLMTLALVLRAVAKASPSLDPSVHPWAIGEEKEDALTRGRVRSLLAHSLLAPECEERLFDESDMFVANAQERLPEFRAAFRNISMIMDCVGCEKCRLWGKLQFLGLGTALRILFAEDDQFELKRNEVVALFNLLNKLLSSVIWMDDLTNELESRARLYSMAGRGLAVLGFLALCMRLNAVTQGRKKHAGTADRERVSAEKSDPKAEAKLSDSATKVATEDNRTARSDQTPPVSSVPEVAPVRRRRKATAE